jgi:putative colanic acid biosysnthesis UDP-glucose lipid carrier transferase
MQATPNILSPHHKVLDFLNRFSDVALLSTSLALAIEFAQEEWKLSATAILLFAIIYHQLAASISNLYESQRSLTVSKQLYRTIATLAGTFALVTMTSALSNRLHAFADREMLFTWFVLSAISFSLWRIILRQVLSQFRQRGINTRHAAIVGASTLGQSLAARFDKNPWMGVQVQSFYDDNASVDHVNNYPVINNFEQLFKDAKDNKFDRVYITLSMAEQESIKKIIDELSDSTCNVFLIPDVFVFDLMNSRQTSIDGLPAIGIYDTPFTLFDSVIKRGFDICTAIGILMFIALPMLAIAIAVKTTSKGPVIFKQIRYGLDGKPIYVWKFRSMTTMDNGNVVKQATKGDTRITPLGGFLRRTSLDELPQFINVLQGQMSIVGPRPHAVAHNEEYRKLIKGYMLRHKVKPGITGWAQINGWRGETDTLDKMEKRVEYDLAYIRDWTVWLDIKIVFLTVFKGFVDKNAY